MRGVIQKRRDFFVPIKDEFPTENHYAGEIGVEVEVEGYGLPQAVPSYWAVHKEGSLRGESAEYALAKPATRMTVKAYVTYLKKFLDKSGATITWSPRTSVHVHINMAQHTLVQVYNYTLCYLIVEDLLTQFAGPHRVGNVFCLRAGDAEWFIDWLTERAKSGYFCPDPDKMRYTSVNVCAVEKFNSLEFRALRGNLDVDVINSWIKMLLALKDVSLKYATPLEIIGDFSRLGSEGFLRRLLPHHADALIPLVPDWDKRLWESVRLVQEVAYAQSWQPPKEKKVGRLFPVGPEKEDEPEWPADVEAEG